MFKKNNNDLSSSIDHDFRPDLITQEGMTGAISALTYDPVQSSFAAGTETGMVHVMGAGEIRAVFDPNPKHKTPSSPIVFLRFVTSVYLVSIDDRSMIVVWALDTRQEWARYQCPYSVLSCWTDASMDWLWLGHRNGEATAFDIDRGHITPWKIPNLEREINPKLVMGCVLGSSSHPRDPALSSLCYRELAVVWNIIKGEIVYHLDYEFPFTQAVWHPSGSHIASSHVNGFIMFWDGQKGVKLGARNAFPAGVSEMDSSQERVASGLAWCCKEDPTDTYLLAWGGRSMSLTDFGPTPIVATSSYDSMGNFFRSTDVPQRELKITSDITLVQVLPKAGNPHFQGAYNPSYAVVLAGGQLICVASPSLQVDVIDSAILPAASCWRAAPITSLSTVGITRNQWIGMMAAAAPNTRVTGGSSATQQIRKSQLSTVSCVGCANGTIKLFDATRADSRDFRVVETTVANLDPQETDHKVTHVSVGREVGEMAAATASGNVFSSFFGKNKRLTQALPPTPCPEIVNVEHLVSPQLTQGFIPQFMFFNRVPVSASCNSNVGFVGIAFENGRVVVIDKRGPALIMDETLKGIVTCMEFGILAVGEDPFSSSLLSMGTSKGEVLVYRIVPRPEGGYQILTKSKEVISSSIGKDPVIHVSHVDVKEGRSAEALPDVMARLASGLQVPGGVLACTGTEARFYGITSSKPGAKPGKKVGTKSFDTPSITASYTFLRWGTASAFATINEKGKVGIYSLPGFKTISTYSLDKPPVGKQVTLSQMGDAFIPYDTAADAGKVIRIFGTDQFPKDDDLWQLKRRVPARPTISTAHWMTGRQYVKPSDVDSKIGGKRRGKSKRARHQLVDEQEAPTDLPAGAAASTYQSQPKSGLKSWFGGSGGKKPQTYEHPRPQPRSPPQKTWGQTFNEYYETAEDTVNGALDEAMESMTSGRKQAQSSALKGIIGSKLGI